MKYLMLCLLLIGFSGCSHADKKLDSDKTLSELKDELSEADKNKYYRLNAVVNKYSSDPITEQNKKEAQEFAQTLLNYPLIPGAKWNYGNVIHHANLVLGRIKLFEGNIKAAKKYLELAAKTPGSPQLDTFGPNMTLAKELLEKGEKAAVLKYFDECSKFWSMESAKKDIDMWKKDIADGKIPEFKAHLVY